MTEQEDSKANPITVLALLALAVVMGVLVWVWRF